MKEIQRKLLDCNRIFISDVVDGEMFFYIRDSLAIKMAEGSPDLTVHISSSGGSTAAGLDIFDLLRFYPGKKIGIVHYMAASMASIILQVCDWRTATTHARVLIHHVSSHNITLDTVRNPEKMKDFSDDMEKAQSKLYQILVNRTGRTAEEITKTCELDNPMSAQEALSYGLIDQIIEKEVDIKIP